MQKTHRIKIIKKKKQIAGFYPDQNTPSNEAIQFRCTEQYVP